MLSLGAFLALAPAPARAASADELTVYSTLDASGGYSRSGGTDVNWLSTRYQGFANAFDPSTAGTLSSVEIALWHVSAVDPIDVNIMTTGPDGGPSGLSLDAGMVPSADYFSSPILLVTYKPANSITLTPGTRYWLTLRPHALGDYDVWLDNISGALGPISRTFNGTSWLTGDNPIGPQNAFRVNIQVPEPTGALAAAAAALLLLRLRRADRTN